MELSIPTPSTREELAKKFTKYALENKNCFTQWFSTVEQCNIPAPESIVIDFPMHLTMAIGDHALNDADNAEMTNIAEQIQAFGRKVGFPVFMKNSLFSGKHYWKETCLITENMSLDDICRNIFNLTEMSLCIGVDFSVYLVIRKMIECKPAFTAFFGEMPVTEEYRVFANKGTVIGYQPYWPEAAIERPSSENWASELKTISSASQTDLKDIFEMASQVTLKLDDSYSVDFLKDSSGKFWLIDMALASESYMSPDFVSFI